MTKSAVLTVAPTAPPPPPGPTLSTLKVSPSSVMGGNSSIGTVTLTGPAPTGGATINLFSGVKTSVTPSVTIPAGDTSATFAITTQEVSSTEVGLVQATYNGSNLATPLTITPTNNGPVPASIAFNPTSVRGGKSSQGT